MLTIRLTRKGKKNQPFFSVVVIDKRRSSKGGRAVEILGYVNPLTKKRSLDKERVLHWISKGAQPSPTVHNLLVSEKVLDAKKINKSKNPKKKAGEQAAPAAQVVAPETKSEEVVKTKEEEAVEIPSSSAKAMEDKKEEPKPEEPKA